MRDYVQAPAIVYLIIPRLSAKLKFLVIRVLETMFLEMA